MHGWSADTACTPEHAEAVTAKTHADDHCALVLLDRAPPHERIVGYCWIDGLGNKDAIPMLGIGIIDEYHEVGMGKALLLLMIEQARMLGLDRIKLGVWADNPRAIYVYQGVGFQTEPTLPAKEFDGRAEIYMVVATGRDRIQQPPQPDK
jgi:ribosomal protein S18 acetylase RimI-like enzyme